MTENLRSAIEKAELTQKSLIALTSQETTFDQRELARLRSLLQHDMLAISRLSREDEDLRSDRSRFAEFKERQNAVHSELSQHQAQWLIPQIEKDRAGYEKATRQIRKSQEDFFIWAKQNV
ncbi:MAG: hypothetical protein AAGL10_12215 [Pseudomonadota bacterium]